MPAPPTAAQKPRWKRPGWRLLPPGLALIAMVWLARFFWSPGLDIRDGRHDLGHNAMWLQHGWIGADSWFKDNDREWKKPMFRSTAKVRDLAAFCARNHIDTVYPHLCPTQPNGSIMAVDDVQSERFLDNAPRLRVLPWIGGPYGGDITPEYPKRNAHFIASVVALLKKHPRLAGVHLNVEPWPDDGKLVGFLTDLHRAMPQGKMLSVAAYPPPSRLHPFPDVHWEESYFRQVAANCDQMVVMMYDTSLKDPKLYQWLYAQWTKQVLNWTAGSKTEILFGLPDYDDAASGYHNPGAENLETSLRGLHRGLASFETLPANYRGAAIYCEWETDAAEWALWRERFLRPERATATSAAAVEGAQPSAAAERDSQGH